MLILAIETSCDETGIAVLDVRPAKSVGAMPNVVVLENLVASQIPIHRPFGGVVPNLAKREHIKNLPILLGKLKTKNLKSKIGLITVTVGPGLEPALWTGIEFAKSLAKEWQKPLVGANHLEGHLYSFLLSTKETKKIKNSKTQRLSSIFPSIALIVSGGHTILLRMDSLTTWKRLGETRDDAAGEAFDKVARLLELPYPGGPEIEKLAAEQTKTKNPSGTITFPRPMLREKNYDFSFSGLKTSVLYYYRDNPTANKTDIATSFQKAAIDVLVTKTMRAAENADAKSVILCGGVAANKALRKTMKTETKKANIEFFVPEFKYNLDNAAMIGLAGYMAYARKKKYPMKANGNLEI
jgi:N6-L-threonylcarbamoyladenine synthase